MNSKIKKMIKVELLILVLLLIIFTVIKLGLIFLIPECIIHKYFGILCPSCQGTRCVASFMYGDFIQSFNYHPVFFITMIYFIFVNILFIINAFRKKDILRFLYPGLKFWIVFLILIAIFTVLRNII